MVRSKLQGDKIGPPTRYNNAHTCGKEDAAKGQPARGAAARSASLE